MNLPLFTLIHTMISLIGIAAGFGAVAGLMAGTLLRCWTAFFIVFTLATSVTGFFFPFNGMTPGIVVGIISVIALAIAIYALYMRKLAGYWRAAYVFTVVLSLYLNFFVLIVQLFQKIPALKETAPHQSEPPFAITQGVTLIVFVWLGIVALRRFRGLQPVA